MTRYEIGGTAAAAICDACATEAVDREDMTRRIVLGAVFGVALVAMVVIFASARRPVVITPLFVAFMAILLVVMGVVAWVQGRLPMLPPWDYVLARLAGHRSFPLEAQRRHENELRRQADEGRIARWGARLAIQARRPVLGARGWDTFWSAYDPLE